MVIIAAIAAVKNLSNAPSPDNAGVPEFPLGTHLSMVIWFTALLMYNTVFRQLSPGKCELKCTYQQFLLTATHADSR